MTNSPHRHPPSDEPPSLMEITMEAYYSDMEDVYEDALAKGLIEVRQP